MSPREVLGGSPNPSHALNICGLTSLEAKLAERIFELQNIKSALQNIKSALRGMNKIIRISSEESSTSGSNPEAPKLTVQERVKDLKAALADSEFEPEMVNIKAAIDACESGEVGYIKNYTPIWAGQVVDTAASYGEFFVARAERLDRYAKKFGPHWLWWESLLDVHPKDQL
ncbi:MAG: hypothetical protein Q9175_002093 [Cornicularia normoerica]